MKEFIESISGDSSVPPTLFKKKKKKRAVDTRATKGRKIKYAVQDRLVNFMVPKSDFTLPFAVQDLFSSLFGKKLETN